MEEYSLQSTGLKSKPLLKSGQIMEEYSLQSTGLKSKPLLKSGQMVI